MKLKNYLFFFVLVTFLFGSNILLVLSQNGFEVILEARLLVNSDTDLRDIGLHDFEVFGQGTISSPFSESFSINGFSYQTFYNASGKSKLFEFLQVFIKDVKHTYKK